MRTAASTVRKSRLHRRIRKPSASPSASNTLNTTGLVTATVLRFLTVIPWVRDASLRLRKCLTPNRTRNCLKHTTSIPSRSCLRHRTIVHGIRRSIPIDQGSPAQIFTQKKSDLRRKYFPKLVLANPAEFDGIWNEYVGEFSKLDVKGYEDLITEEVAKKIANAQGQ